VNSLLQIQQLTHTIHIHNTNPLLHVSATDCIIKEPHQYLQPSEVC